MSAKAESYRHLGETMIKRFGKRGMNAFYCDTRKEAVKKVLELIPSGASVTWGGSETLTESGILDAVKNGGYELIDRSAAGTPEEKRSMFAKQSLSDYFLMSTNAFTADGELVNIDGRGNRVCFLIAGPEHVIVIAGMNKFASTVPEALDRVHNEAAPPNCVRLGLKTPCAVTGLCQDCHGENTICCQEVITRHSMIPGRIQIILVGEELGF